ncbi:MAG: hypothetical protein ACREHD_14345 [Pirellulales bacterium]
MSEFLSKFDSGEMIGLVAMAGGFVCAITAILGGIVSKCWCHNRELSFKQNMIARGMSADEIRMVIESGARPPFATSGCHGVHGDAAQQV